MVLDQDLIERLHVDKDYIKSQYLKELDEALRREEVYSQSKKVSLKNRTVILVDDGIATGATIEAAIGAIRDKKPRRLVLAVPVAPASSVKKLEKLVDRAVVLHSPQDFYAIGQFYSSFPQVTDQEVIKILRGKGR